MTPRCLVLWSASRGWEWGQAGNSPGPPGSPLPTLRSEGEGWKWGIVGDILSAPDPAPSAANVCQFAHPPKAEDVSPGSGVSSGLDHGHTECRGRATLVPYGWSPIPGISLKGISDLHPSLSLCLPINMIMTHKMKQ